MMHVQCKYEAAFLGTNGQDFFLVVGCHRPLISVILLASPTHPPLISQIFGSAPHILASRPSQCGQQALVEEALKARAIKKRVEEKRREEFQWMIYCTTYLSLTTLVGTLVTLYSLTSK